MPTMRPIRQTGQLLDQIPRGRAGMVELHPEDTTGPDVVAGLVEPGLQLGDC
jgi:hypothetical protein